MERQAAGCLLARPGDLRAGAAESRRIWILQAFSFGSRRNGRDQFAVSAARAFIY